MRTLRRIHSKEEKSIFYRNRAPQDCAKLWADSPALIRACEAYLPSLYKLVELERAGSISVKPGQGSRWTNAFPVMGAEEHSVGIATAVARDVDADATLRLSDDTSTHIYLCPSLHHERCHVCFLLAIAQYSKGSLRMQQLRCGANARASAEAWHNLRVAAGIFTHLARECSHHKNVRHGADMLLAQTSGIALGLLSGICCAQVQGIAAFSSIQRHERQPLQIAHMRDLLPRLLPAI